MHQQFKKEYAVKKWDELSVRWTDDEEQALKRACRIARDGCAFVTFEFRICPSHNTKPVFPDGESNSKEAPASSPSSSSESRKHDHAHDKDPTATASNGTDVGATEPKSDIDNGTPEWHITDVLGTHRLILNKFSIYRPAVHPPDRLRLPPADIPTDGHRLHRRLDGPPDAARTNHDHGSREHYVIFNCGKQSGSSRLHKHMQDQDRDQGQDRVVRDEVARPPYVYSLNQLGLDPSENVVKAGQEIEEIYTRHVRDCAAALGLQVPGVDDEQESGQGIIIPHNMILTKDWIMTLPRREAGVGAATANSAGMLGLVWVPRKEVVELWREIGPTRVLESVGVPRRE
ncbi:hypothetical protein MRB53_042225 [Persea americana]|nr:hypothetical protein MRB53_042225 [Persea americana]